jgi:succinyl-CoA synthetase beta subunit
MGHFKETGFKGGVKVVDTPEQARDLAKEFLGNHLVTK